MKFRSTPTVNEITAVEMSLNGEDWKLLAMAVNQRAATALVNSLDLLQETYSQESLNEILEGLED